MAKERKASVIYEGNANQLVYAFPFDYLRKKFVKVEDIYTNITELTIGVDYTVEDKQVRLVKGIPLGHSVKIYRETTTAPLVEWQDASVLRSADLSLQEVQLLHLAEETGDRVFDSGMSTAYDNPNCWDGQYKRIINVLDPIEDGDVVTLRYIKANQDSLLNQLKNTGETQNARLIATGDTQNTRLVTTGNSYVSTMTTLRDATTTKATEANNSADLAKKWAVSETSPDGAEASKSARTWAGAAKISASAAASSANASQTSAANSASSASVSTQKATDAANSASAAASSASKAASSATAAKASETNAANSAAAAKASADRAATFDPTSYYTKTEVDALRESDKPVQVPITNLVGASFITDVNCQKSGHVVCVQFTVIKTQNAGYGTRETASLLGFPRPSMGTVWVQASTMGDSDSASSPRTLRGFIQEDYFTWHYTPNWQQTTGDECSCYITYLTND